MEGASASPRLRTVALSSKRAPAAGVAHRGAELEAGAGGGAAVAGGGRFDDQIGRGRGADGYLDGSGAVVGGVGFSGDGVDAGAVVVGPRLVGRGEVDRLGAGLGCVETAHDVGADLGVPGGDHSIGGAVVAERGGGRVGVAAVAHRGAELEAGAGGGAAVAGGGRFDDQIGRGRGADGYLDGSGAVVAASDSPETGSTQAP